MGCIAIGFASTTTGAAVVAPARNSFFEPGGGTPTGGTLAGGASVFFALGGSVRTAGGSCGLFPTEPAFAISAHLTCAAPTKQAGAPIKSVAVTLTSQPRAGAPCPGSARGAD